MTLCRSSLCLARIWLCAAFALILGGPASVSASTIQAAETTVRVAYIGDPQIGFGGFERDYYFLTQVIDEVQNSEAEALVVAGDLTQDRTFLQRWLFRRAIAGLKRPVMLTPGNHDIVDTEDLHRYRAELGPDYFVQDQGPISFLVINSETARSPALSTAEYENQWQFIESTAEAKFKSGQRIVLLLHRPPFVSTEDEPDSESAWPQPERGRLLALCRRFGINLILAGHLHRTQVVSTSDGIQIRILSGSARSYDASLIGFEDLALSRTATQATFHRVAGPRPAPPSIPGLGYWTPRLIDFSLYHWFFSVFFAVAAQRCLGAARLSGAPSPRSSWLLVSGVMLFFSVNMQLDFDELITAVGRVGAQLVGLSSIRHLLTASGMVVFLGFGAWRLRRALLSRDDRSALLAKCATCIPIAWFCLSAASHHDLQMIFSQNTWDLAFFLAVVIVIGTAQNSVSDSRNSSRSTAGTAR